MKKFAIAMVVAAFFVGCGTSTPKQQEAEVAPVEEVIIEQEAAEVVDSSAVIVEEVAEEVAEVAE